MFFLNYEKQKKKKKQKENFKEEDLNKETSEESK